MINHTIGGSIKIALVFERANPSIFPIVGLKETSAILRIKSEMRKFHHTFLVFSVYHSNVQQTIKYNTIEKVDY